MLDTVLQIDLRGAPLKAKMKGYQRNTNGLIEYLQKRDGLKQIKVSHCEVDTCLTLHKIDQFRVHFSARRRQAVVVRSTVVSDALSPDLTPTQTMSRGTCFRLNTELPVR